MTMSSQLVPWKSEVYGNLPAQGASPGHSIRSVTGVCIYYDQGYDLNFFLLRSPLLRGVMELDGMDMGAAEEQWMAFIGVLGFSALGNLDSTV